MKKLITILSLFFTTQMMGQVTVIHFNADWNKSHNVEWVDELSDCDIEFVDIAKKPKLQSEYSIVVVPTIIVLQYDEEKKRYQADLSFKLTATKEEVQEYIDELILSGF